MARQKDEEKRIAILTAAARVIAEEGLGAPTAKIARTAKVADGTLFVYFPNKDILFNELYLHVKRELTSRVSAAVPREADLRTQLKASWKAWTAWGVQHPAERRALAQLAVSDRITPETRATGLKGVEEMFALIGMISAQGPMRQAPAMFVGAVMEAVATTTMDHMAREPGAASTICEWGFEAVWGALTAKPVPGDGARGASRGKRKL